MRLHTAAGYQVTTRYNFLRQVEQDVLFAYVDTAFFQQRGTGIATIGVGINLREHAQLILQTLGFDVSGTGLTGAALVAEQGYINELLTAFGQEYPSDNTARQCPAAC